MIADSGQPTLFAPSWSGAGNEDSFSLWLEECVTVASEFSFETTADLFKSWKAWAERTGEQSGTMKRFFQTLQTRGYLSKRQAHTGQRGFEGVRIKRPDYSEDPRYGDG